MRHSGIVIDVTERKEAEIARVVRALTVGELTSSIAHEVNQPLAGVVTNAEAGLRWLSRDTPDVEEAKESLALVVRDGVRAGAVIQRIRSLLRKESPQAELLNISDVTTLSKFAALRSKPVGKPDPGSLTIWPGNGSGVSRVMPETSRALELDNETGPQFQ